MDERTLTALNNSIRKWELISERNGHDDGIQNCALCKLFYKDDLTDPLAREIEYCKGCPVREKTGVKWCSKSPYNDWKDHFIDSHGEQRFDDILNVEVDIHPFGYPVDGCEECVKLAREELEFLRSLEDHE